jgi:hypothetical protein
MRKYRHSILEERTLGGGYRAISEGPIDVKDLLNTALSLFTYSRQEAVWKFNQLFYCYRTPSDKDIFCSTVMLDSIVQDLIKCEIEFISTPPDIIGLSEHSVEKKRVVESAEHKGMKEWVRKHYLSKGIILARDEVSVLGYEVDAGLAQEDIFVECGDTPASKVFEFLKADYRIGILQYDSEEILWLIPDDKFPAFAKEITLSLVVNAIPSCKE